MTDVDAELVLLPWVRRGGSTALTQPDTMGAGQPGVASAQVTVEVNTTEQLTMDVALVGPGDVTGLQSGQVIRTDPVAGSVVFEPNYLALVEFDEPSLPWLFTPARATTQGRLRPWLCLAVVRKQDGVQLTPPQLGSVPVLQISAPAVPAVELPDLADSWAWAHAQVTADTGLAPDALQQVLGASPERSLARLLCGRVLEPDTQYLACVVPTFDLGRQAGLGLDVTAADLATLDPAWAAGQPAVELPVYYHWDFQTGPGGDFQSLALLLRARPLPDGVGVRSFDVSRSGVDVTVPSATRLEIGGALQPVDSTPPTWPDEGVHAAYRTELARLLNLATDDDPLLAPPRYGGVQSGLGAVDPARSTRWYEQLNLEPAARVAAQLGTRVVQEQQEALVASAWEQAADLRAVNQTLRHAQLGCLVAWSLHGRHLSTMTPDTGLQVIAPAQARMTRAPEAHVAGTGLVALLADTQLSPGAFGAPLRRITRPQGALNRRLQRSARVLGPGAGPTGPATAPVIASVTAPVTASVTASVFGPIFGPVVKPVTGAGDEPAAPRVPRTTSILSSLQPSRVLGRRLVPTTGPATVERVAAALTPPRDDIGWGEATAAAVQAVPPRPDFHLLPLTRPRPDPFPTPFPTPFPAPFPAPHHPPPHDLPIIKVDSADARAFRAAARTHLARFDPTPPVVDVLPTHVADLGDVYAAALTLAEPRATYARAIELVVDLGGGTGTGTGTDDQALDQVGLTPYFPQPMALSLAELGQELMLPGLEAVPPNTVVPLETNTPFVEAYLVGINAELGRELVWREFPTPARATYVDRFWDTSGSPGAAPDIPPLTEWADRALGAGSGGPERFVMLVRSDLLRRYPNAIVYAAKPATTTAPEQQSYPVFTGAMEPDVRFFGFDLSADEIADWSIVIQEQPSAPRFGVEVGTDLGGATHLPAPDLHAARLAQRLRQTPVRISIPSAVLLREV